MVGGLLSAIVESDKQKKGEAAASRNKNIYCLKPKNLNKTKNTT